MNRITLILLLLALIIIIPCQAVHYHSSAGSAGHRLQSVGSYSPLAQAANGSYIYYVNITGLPSSIKYSGFVWSDGYQSYYPQHLAIQSGNRNFIIYTPSTDSYNYGIEIWPLTVPGFSVSAPNKVAYNFYTDGSQNYNITYSGNPVSPIYTVGITPNPATLGERITEHASAVTLNDLNNTVITFGASDGTLLNSSENLSQQIPAYSVYAVPNSSNEYYVVYSWPQTSASNSLWLNSSSSARINVTLSFSVSGGGIYANQSFLETVYHTLNVSISSSLNPSGAALPVNFTSSVSGISYKLDWKIYSGPSSSYPVLYQSDNASISYIFVNTGDYLVSLTASNQYVNSTASIVEIVDKPPPTVEFVHTGIPVANLSYAMSFEIDSRFPYSQTVTMPNGTEFSGKNFTVSYTFLEAGDQKMVSRVYYGSTLIETVNFSLIIEINVRILPTALTGLSPLAEHFESSVQGSSNCSYSWILMPGVVSTLPDPSETYPYGNWTVSLVVNGNNNTTGQESIVIHSGLSAFMRLYPDISVSMGIVYLNSSIISNYTIDHVYATVNGLSGTFNVSLNLTGSRGTNYSYSATMDEFSLLAGNYSVNLTAISSAGINRTSSAFVVNFTFAQVTLEPEIQISGGLLNVTVTAISDYTVHYVSLQVSGPSGITDYNLTLNYYQGTTSRWGISIDEYALGNGVYSALISAHNSRGFTDYSTFPFNVTSPNQGFSFAQFISDIGGPVSFLTLMGVIVMAIGVAVGIGQHGTETVYIGGQKYKAKPGKPLKRMKGGKK
jgi:hypothetical protein